MVCGAWRKFRFKNYAQASFFFCPLIRFIAKVWSLPWIFIRKVFILEKQEDLYGLVLTGGHSSRMGTDKSLLVYNSKPQREYLFELLNTFCQRVFTSCRKDQQVPSHLNPLTDRFDIAGPINGILSAFAHDPHKSWLVIAVDMPFVDAQALSLLISNRDRARLATCFYNAEQQQPEPLLTLWEEKAYPHLLKFMQNGNMSPREFLETHPVNQVDPPHAKTIVNINFPKDKS